MDDICDHNELESKLYAQIHHEPVTADDTNVNLTTNSAIKSNLDSTSTNNEKTPTTTSTAVAADKQPQKFSGHHKNINPLSKTKVPQDVSKTISNPNSNARPKPFTPYTSYLAQIDSLPLVNGDNNTTATTDTEIPNDENNRMLNPFSKKNQEKCVKAKKFFKEKRQREKAKKNRKLNKFKKPSIISLSSSDDKINIMSDDDDDVIILPSQPISIYTIDSSDDEDDGGNREDATNQNDVQSKIKSSTSPTPSLQSVDDYIGQNDLSRVCRQSNDEALGDIDDYELNLIDESIEKIKRAEIIEKQHCTEHVISECQTEQTNNDDDLSFIKPTTSKQSKSYEVSDNSFAAAIDVYESESSDMPDTIYTTKQQMSSSAAAADQQPKTNSDSECSDIIFETVNRQKRLKKRKYSTSTKGSDHHDENSDDEANDNNKSSDFDLSPIKRTIENPSKCIVRGDAIANAVTTDTRKITKSKLKKRKNLEQSEQSDEEFISMLSTCVHSEFKNKKFHGYKDILSGPQKPISPIPVQKQQQSEWIVTEQPATTIDNNTSVTSTPKIVKNQQTNDSGNVLNRNDIQLNITDGNIVLDIAGPSESITKKAIHFTEEYLKNILPNKSTDKPSTTNSLTNDKRIKSSDSDIKGKSVVSCSLGVDPECGWNEEMKCFYNKSWGGETHDTSAIQRSMPSNFLSKWFLLYLR